MPSQKFKDKRREWLGRYIPAEILGTATALAGAWVVFAYSGSYAAATGAGWFSEGIGFYGYFITTELLKSSRKYRQHRFFKRLSLAIGAASTNLLVEFLPAELVDNFLIRPGLMFAIPHAVHPYPVGFLVAKFSADILFYVFAIAGYESRKRWLKR